MNQKLGHALWASCHAPRRRGHVVEVPTNAPVADLWYCRNLRGLVENVPVDVLFELGKVCLYGWHRRSRVQRMITETSKQIGTDESVWRADQKDAVIFASLTEVCTPRRNQRNILFVDGECERGDRAEVERHKVVDHATVGQLKLVCFTAVHNFLVRSLMAALRGLMTLCPNFTIHQKSR
jgi:hypothetical protein